MSRALTFQEMADVMMFISANNSPYGGARPGLPVIKYMKPHIDFRTNTIHSVVLRKFGGVEVEFHCVNEFRDMQLSMKERIMAFLTTGKLTLEEQAISQVGKATREALEANEEFYWALTHHKAEYVK
jgi:hypothetical protein